MSATLLNGREVSNSVTQSLKETLETLPYQPQLVVVRVGEDPASVSYVRGKDRTAKRLGLSSRVEVLPEETPQAELTALIAELNADDEVDGILVQDPLPPHLDIKPVQEAIDPAKDVDGFHPVNVGRLWSGQKALVPCTPAGIMRIMDFYELPMEASTR